MLLGCHETVTIWIKTRNPDTKKDEWERAVIPVAVKWDSKTIRTVTENGAIIKQFIVVVIPYDESYKFKFNGKSGDLIALGEHSVEITGVSPFTVSEVRRSLEPDVAEIKAVSSNFRVERGRHVRVEGV